ncbi:MAG: hypothetical protein EU550_00280 [Promethearchaeota archaeon]|nr:MAG: hypothetical protein EU550_00280 [Candidatus Lokiarchaeota archaeon]
MSEEFITKRYICNVCHKTHEISLNRKLVENRKKYPFPYVFLHDFIENGENKEVLTILYIDKGLKIRGAEVQELQEDNLFSKEQVVAIVQPLMEEIENLRNENLDLREKLQKK